MPSSPSRSTPTDFALRLSHVLFFASLVTIAGLTLLDRGATRIYSTPWHAWLWFAQAAALAAVPLRALSHAQPFSTPTRSWSLLAAAFGFVVPLAALASPYRGSSLPASLTLLSSLAVFFLIHDWLAAARERRESQLLLATSLFFVGLALSSLARWIVGDLIPSGAWRHAAALIDHRNAEPLGHSNYTAGLALLMLPCFLTLAARRRGPARLGWVLALLLALALLLSSGSRGALVGLAALLFAALLQIGLGWKKLLVALTASAALILGLAFLHPRTRAMLLTRPLPAAAPNISNVQRTAMFDAGLAMGRDRPLLGWGTGTTPLVFPRYRAQLEGGAENVLQLHSLPLQLWADLGALGCLCALAFVVFVLRARPFTEAPTAAWLLLIGYGVFALTDAQLDVPVFPFVLAIAAALLAPTAAAASRTTPRILALAAIAALLIIRGFARPDPAPRANSLALQLARDPAQADAAIALLRDSLASNPDQEIAHFNLGWLLVTRDPAAAEKHFLAAAHLVPDKGGVYFGLALARLNQNHRDSAVRALALECLNDPLFLSSPWWRVPSLAALRPAATTEASRALTALRPALASRSAYATRELDYLAAFIPWLDGQGHLGDVLAAARTPERVRYFAARPSPPDFSTGPVHAFHRERTGYPVLMRDLDLPPPVDIFEIQENARAADKLAFLFPAKGWLPSPLFLSLLDAPPHAP